MRNAAIGRSAALRITASKCRLSMSAELVAVQLPGNWSDLFEGLPGWERSGVDRWVGAGAVFQGDVQPADAYSVIRLTSAERRVELVIGAQSSRLREIEAPPSPTIFNATTPSLCHVAIDVGQSDLSISTLLTECGVPVLIPRERRFDPAVGADVDAEHFYVRNRLYLTQRFSADVLAGPRLAHVGMEFAARDDIDQVHTLLQRIGWPIVVAPVVVDGSYLVHFEGPDGRVHDAYSVVDPPSASSASRANAAGEDR